MSIRRKPKNTALFNKLSHYVRIPTGGLMCVGEDQATYSES